MATRIGVIDRGRLVQVGTPREIYESPVNVYVATRLGQPAINLVPRRALPDAAGAARRRRPSARAPSTCASPRRATAAALGTCRWIEHLGDQNHLHVAHRRARRS